MADLSSSLPSINYSPIACTECQLLRKEMKQLTAELNYLKDITKGANSILAERVEEIQHLKQDKKYLERKLSEQKAKTVRIQQKYSDLLRWQQSAFELIQERGKNVDSLAQAGLEKTAEGLRNLD